MLVNLENPTSKQKKNHNHPDRSEDILKRDVCTALQLSDGTQGIGIFTRVLFWGEKRARAPVSPRGVVSLLERVSKVLTTCRINQALGARQWNTSGWLDYIDQNCSAMYTPCSSFKTLYHNIAEDGRSLDIFISLPSEHIEHFFFFTYSLSNYWSAEDKNQA